MSEHRWVHEHVAAYLAGGLGAQEAERLESHARDCPACGAVLADARRLDERLGGLFEGVCPDPGLEDRTVDRLRGAQTRPSPAFDLRAKWAVAAAAVLVLAAIGAVAGSLASHGDLGTPDPAYLSRVGGLEDSDKEAGAERAAARAAAEASANREREQEMRAGVRRSHSGIVDYEVATPNGPTGKPAGPPGGGAPKEPQDRIPVPPPALDGVTDPTYSPPPPGGPPPLVPASPPPPLTIPAVVPANPPAPPPVPGWSAFDPVASKPSLTVPGASQPGEPKVEAKPGSEPGPADPARPPGADPKKPEPSPEPMRRIILRSGDMEFEVESFDGATAAVTKLVLAVKGAFVATINSDKLPNGKVRGSITVRVPPEHLDGLVLDLRRELGKGGELKGVKLTSQDVTKMYTDLESRLRAARTMEQRLLQIIKEGKGEIKQLLEAERELGVWRTKIEETEGELRYYSNLAALSTLTVSLSEKEIRAAAAVTERERVQAGVEVEDVDRAYQQVLAAVLEVKGRITKSELKQLSAGQFNAAFQFEVAPEASGPIRDRLRTLGRVARLEIDRSAQIEGGTLPSDAKTKRGDTVFLVQLYNLANVAPRETAQLQVAVADVPAAYQALRDAVAKVAGRVLVAQLNEQDRQNISAQFDFEVRRADEGAVRAALEAAGEVLSRQVSRAAESDSVTDSKVLYKVGLVSAGRLRPRETVTLTVEVPNVDESATLFAAQVAEAKGRQVDAKLDRAARGQQTAHLVFEVPLSAAAGLAERFKAAGTVRAAQSARDPQATDGRYATARIEVTLTNVEAIVADGNGLWPKVRRGLAISASVLLTSVTWVVFGLCVVLPWAVIGLGGYRIVRRFVQPVVVAPAPPAAPPPAAV